MTWRFITRHFHWLAGLVLGVLFHLAHADPTLTAFPPFRLGIVNERLDRPDFALRQYGKLHARLLETLARHNIQTAPLVVSDDMAKIAEKFTSGALDAVIEGVMPTLRIQQRTGVLEPTLLVWRKGQRQYHSVFFVRKDSPFDTLESLRGQTIVFESPRSTSAFFVPLVTLKGQGLSVLPATTETLDAGAVRYEFAESELNQAYWVHRGKAHAGAFNDGDWQRVPEIIRKDLRIIAQTPPLLRWLFSFHTDVDPRIKQAVTEALVAMHETKPGREALQAAENIVQFEPLSAADIDSLAHWRKQLSHLDSTL
ncbi:MAG: phosphate/phosphite/phosphonate ABC transporter substrate-binding protein [Candidatus Competibacteraceae bacterium]|jgi:phosphonate transport system substrate-binding protein|nr:phosphate/phosphite/phosphonate ABC transporter substrate-binding protein [Candidatus Competibacteraceae bacterium]